MSMKNLRMMAIMAGMMGSMDSRNDRINSKEIDTTKKQTRPAAGCKEYWFNKNGGFSNGLDNPMKKSESVFYCHAINDKSAKNKFDKWYKLNIGNIFKL